ncbi:hypothetical protein BCR44DRAFT_43594 [Catenaria anguillulae PL171]|uniref:Uncharacterized protein n=1 Tax=Catenaria anguillulae PL171 TaxID=765915 RepID=A0A1Y2I2K1_9FUNG|nr:hypothetical protein BCR44DRAFT_43594 [Catenaria anguillulae PL171]
MCQLQTGCSWGWDQGVCLRSKLGDGDGCGQSEIMGPLAICSESCCFRIECRQSDGRGG